MLLRGEDEGERGGRGVGVDAFPRRKFGGEMYVLGLRLLVDGAITVR